MGNLSDEQLLKRANHASRNLGAVATLASLGSLALIGCMFVFRDSALRMGMLGISIGLIAGACWTLMVAAKRGDPASVTGLLIAVAAQIVLSLGMTVLTGMNDPEAAGRNIGGFVVPFLVLVALYSSRSVLLELRERGLWDKAFAGARPVGALCMIGNGLLVAGFLSFNGGSVFVGIQTGREMAAEKRKAQVFPSILMTEEKAFMEALGKASNQTDPAAPAAEADRAEMWKRLAALQARVEVARKDAADNRKLLGILNTYSNAVDLWKKGLEAMTREDGDAVKGQQLLNQGDGLRGSAIAEFDNTYAKPRKQP